MAKKKSLTLTAISGSQGLYRRRALDEAIKLQKNAGWRIEHVDGSSKDELLSAMSQGGIMFEDNQVLVVVSNPEKADLKLLQEQLDDGEDGIVLLLHYEGDPKGNTKFGKWLKALGSKLHRNFPAPPDNRPWEAEPLAIDFCVAEAKRLGQVLPGSLAKAIVTRCGTDFGVLSFELLKMCTLAGLDGVTELTPQQIKPVMAPLMEATLTPITEALSVKSGVGLSRALDRVKATHKGDPTMSVCGWVGSMALRWLGAVELRGKNPDEAADLLREHPWFFKNKLLPQVRYWKREEVVRLLKVIGESQRGVLSGHVAPWTGLTARLLAICG